MNMKLWNVSSDSKSRKLELDLRDLGGHLDFTCGAWAGSLSYRVWEAKHGVAAGCFSLEFEVKLGLVSGSVSACWAACC